MKHSIRIRLIVIFTSMIIFTIGVCWCMNRFLLASFYEKSKITQLDDVYERLNTIRKGVDWEKLSEDKRNELFNKIDGIGANQV